MIEQLYMVAFFAGIPVGYALCWGRNRSITKRWERLAEDSRRERIRAEAIQRHTRESPLPSDSLRGLYDA